MGYSDVTSLHLLFNQECDLVTFHGPMVSSNMVDQFDEETKNSFMDALTAEKEYAYPAPKGYTVGIAREGRAAVSYTHLDVYKRQLDEFVALKLLQNFSQFYIADTVALLSQLLYQQGTRCV